MKEITPTVEVGWSLTYPEVPLRIKYGVDVNGLKPEIVLAFHIASVLYQEYGYDCVLTSGLEGKHARQSSHYLGFAIDLRTRDFPVDMAVKVAKELQARLTVDYQVILESDHIHVQFKPIRVNFAT